VAGALEAPLLPFLFSNGFAVNLCSSYRAWVGQWGLAVAGAPSETHRSPPLPTPLLLELGSGQEKGIVRFGSSRGACQFPWFRRRSRRRREGVVSALISCRPLFCFADRWGPLTGGSQALVTQASEASSLFQILMLFCEICISSLVDPSGVIQILVESQ